MLIDVVGTADFEIVLGFAAPIGTDLDVLVGPLQDELRIYGYDSEEIRLSRLLDVAPDNPDSVDYYTDRMDAGDALRKRAGSGDVLAALAVGKIVTDRLPDEPNRRFAWLLRTLKHKDEVALLRHAYGKRFVLIGVHQGQQRRQRNLVASLRDESPGGTNHAAAVENLMRRDENDLENEFGQHGRNVFASADYLVDLDRDVSTETSRMVGLLFGEPFRTPSRDEVGMAHAFTAAARSADPGRQVGAAITLESGELLTTGSNEVPKSGGGEYWSGDAPDGRDFAEGYDFNKRQTRRTLREVLTSLEAGGFLSTEMASLTTEDRLVRVLDSTEANIKRTRLLSLIEFGRIVHAEMSALSQAARLGVAVSGATLYTTAYPCHMCMRLIVASGIKRIVYVDPYPKSLAGEMYGDSVTADPGESKTKVLVESFRGASWSIYNRVFSGQDRRRAADGKFAQFDKQKSRFTLADAEPLANPAAREAAITIIMSDVLGRTEVETEASEAPEDGSESEGAVETKKGES